MEKNQLKERLMYRKHILEQRKKENQAIINKLTRKINRLNEGEN